MKKAEAKKFKKQFEYSKEETDELIKQANELGVSTTRERSAYSSAITDFYTRIPFDWACKIISNESRSSLPENIDSLKDEEWYLSISSDVDFEFGSQTFARIECIKKEPIPTNILHQNIDSHIKRLEIKKAQKEKDRIRKELEASKLRESELKMLKKLAKKYNFELDEAGNGYNKGR